MTRLLSKLTFNQKLGLVAALAPGSLLAYLSLKLHPVDAQWLANYTQNLPVSATEIAVAAFAWGARFALFASFARLARQRLAGFTRRLRGVATTFGGIR